MVGLLTRSLWTLQGDAPGTNAEDWVPAMPIFREHEILKCPKDMIYIDLFWFSVTDKVASVAGEAKSAVKETTRASLDGAALC
jgi:hypothetical protein